LHNTRLSETESSELEEGQSVTVQIQDFDVESKRIELQLSRAETSLEEQAPSTLGDAFEDIFAALEQSVKQPKGRLKKR
jgi:ribosomal protein S1